MPQHIVILIMLRLIRSESILSISTRFGVAEELIIDIKMEMAQGSAINHKRILELYGTNRLASVAAVAESA